jgi:transposase
MGLSFGKTAAILRTMGGLTVTRSMIVRALKRVGDRSVPTYDALCEQVRTAPVVTADETGWRVGGFGAWLWDFVTDRITVYAIEDSRSFDVAKSVLDEDYAGILVRDGYASYRLFTKARHQTCIAHLLRRTHNLLEILDDRDREIPAAVRLLLKDAMAVRDRRVAGESDVAAVADAVKGLESRRDIILETPATNDENRKLLKHLRKERNAMFTFLREEGDVPATNWRAEQGIRPAVVNRKVWGGNRSWPGARVQEMVMSLLRTSRQQDCDPIGLITNLLRSPKPTLALIPSLVPP